MLEVMEDADQLEYEARFKQLGSALTESRVAFAPTSRDPQEEQRAKRTELSTDVGVPNYATPLGRESHCTTGHRPGLRRRCFQVGCERSMRHLLAAALFCWLAGPHLAGAEEPGTVAFAQLAPIVVHGNEADNLLLGAGVFHIRDGTSAAGTIEYRFGRKVFVAGLSLGLMANVDGGLFGYVGTYGDLSYKRIYFTPQIAMGGYHTGDSWISAACFNSACPWTLPIGSTTATALERGRVAHISNAGVNEQNPGEEELFLTYSISRGPVSVSGSPRSRVRKNCIAAGRLHQGGAIATPSHPRLGPACASVTVGLVLRH